ncbi:MAG: YggS family pyridoxal phosphate-dependent enzyme [Proteobacteria bacterium]|jgi:PLP dependent protein|nr:YggS family pyridoxal phosphate-dependent enzyme [Pseudomonadota bacterium]
MPSQTEQHPVQSLQQQIDQLCQKHARAKGSVTLMAVSKTRSIEEVRLAASFGQRDFGENYVQEGVDKVVALADLGLTWHFIGPIQKNKTRVIAEHFDWVHSIEREIIADRLSTQRPTDLAPLNVCIQINIDNEETKSGVAVDDVSALAQHISTLPGLRLRGLMAIPSPGTDFQQQCASFSRMKDLQQQLLSAGIPLDTLSMGMSNDFEAAIASGSSIVRIGTAIFGRREVIKK